jgi:phage tail-like protein
LFNICRHRFYVDIGSERYGFKEVEGVCVNIEAHEYRDGTDPTSAPRSIPGLVRYGPLVLRYGIAGNPINSDLWNWIKQTIEGNEQKRNVAVVVLDRKGIPVAKYALTGAWPSNWRLSKLDGLIGSPLLEELVLQYEKLDIEYLKPSTQ